jgi:hypothetical protein
MAEESGLAGFESSLTKDVGGVPVWALGAGAGVLIAVVWWLSKRNEGTVTQSVYDPNSAAGVGTDTPTDPLADAVQQWLGNNPDSPALVGNPALPAPISNAQWAKQVIDQLLASGSDPSLVTNAITKYLAGKGLTQAEKAVVDLALQKFGSPPEGSIAVIDQPTTGALPIVTKLQVTGVTRSTISYSWDYDLVNGAAPQVQYLYKSNPPDQSLRPWYVKTASVRTNTVHNLKPGTKYVLGVAATNGTNLGQMATVSVSTSK